MNRTHPLAVLIFSLLLLAAAGSAIAQEDGPDEDPFADDPGLFGEEDEEDPFAELEERANVSDDGGNASDGDGADASGDGTEGDEEQNGIPFPVLSALAGLLLAARLTSRSEG